jgi:hypothetical protein
MALFATLFYALRDGTIKSIKRMGHHFILSPLAIRVTDLSFKRESAPCVYLWRKDICGQGDLSEVLSALVTDQGTLGFSKQSNNYWQR